MPEPESAPVHVMRMSTRCVVEAVSSARPVRRPGFGAVAVGTVVSIVTRGELTGPAGPTFSAASETMPAFRYRPTVPDEQPVRVIVYAAPLPTGAPMTQFGALPTRVKSPASRPVIGAAKVSAKVTVDDLVMSGVVFTNERTPVSGVGWSWIVNGPVPSAPALPARSVAWSVHV